MYLDAESTSQLDELLWLGPRSVQLIVGNLSSLDANPLTKLLTAQMQGSPQLFNSNTKRHSEVKHALIFAPQVVQGKWSLNSFFMIFKCMVS